MKPMPRDGTANGLRLGIIYLPSSSRSDPFGIMAEGVPRIGRGHQSGAGGPIAALFNSCKEEIMAFFDIKLASCKKEDLIFFIRQLYTTVADEKDQTNRQIIQAVQDNRINDAHHFIGSHRALVELFNVLDKATDVEGI